MIIEGILESTFINGLIATYACWIHDKLLNCYDRRYWESQGVITANIKNYYNVLRIREHMKEILLGHFYQHNLEIEKLLLKSWQNDYYADAAVSSIRHKMGPNVGM